MQAKIQELKRNLHSSQWLDHIDCFWEEKHLRREKRGWKEVKGEWREGGTKAGWGEERE